jgi:dienelactone hydrolase
LGEAVDRRRIAAAGHSYGANTTLLAAGARVQREGAWRSFQDTRVQAAIVLSAPPFYGEASAVDILSPITVPSLHITTRQDVIRIPGYYSGLDDRLAVYQAMGGPHKTLAVFKEGSHSVFTDRVHHPALKQATQALAQAFLQQVFEGRPQALVAWPQRHAALVAQFDQAGGAAV